MFHSKHRECSTFQCKKCKCWYYILSRQANTAQDLPVKGSGFPSEARGYNTCSLKEVLCHPSKIPRQSLQATTWDEKPSFGTEPFLQVRPATGCCWFWSFCSSVTTDSLINNNQNLGKAKKLSVLRKCLLNPQHFSKFVLLHSHYVAESDSYTEPWPAWASSCRTASQWHLRDTSMSSVCPLHHQHWHRPGQAEFPNGRGQSQLCALHISSGIFGLLIPEDLMPIIMQVYNEEKCLLICRICTTCFNISSLPKQIPSL